MPDPIPETRLAEIEALCAEIAERIRTQDNAGTAHPYFVVYEGDPNKSPDRWRFVSLFLTRDSAKAFILGQRHNLRRPFVFVESAHNNHEIRAAREVFAALPELAREVRRLRGEAEKLTVQRDQTALADDAALAEVARLRAAACVWYGPDGPETLATPEAVIERRKAAAAEMERLRAVAVAAGLYIVAVKGGRPDMRGFREADLRSALRDAGIGGGA